MLFSFVILPLAVWVIHSSVCGLLVVVPRICRPYVCWICWIGLASVTLLEPANSRDTTSMFMLIMHEPESPGLLMLV